MSAVITPVPGRVVWYYHRRLAGEPMAIIDPRQPMAATIAYVHNDRCVNLSVVDHRGAQHKVEACVLVQPGDDDLPYQSYQSYCEWMPYQKGQAQKTEEVMSKLSQTSGVASVGTEAAPTEEKAQKKDVAPKPDTVVQSPKAEEKAAAPKPAAKPEAKDDGALAGSAGASGKV